MRLLRLPRLLKLLDTQKFKRALDQLNTYYGQGEMPNIKMIKRMRFYLDTYNQIRLIFIMLFMVYGIGCMFFLLSEYYNEVQM